MHIGPLRQSCATIRNVVTVDNTDQIETEYQVALNVMNCDQSPLVARVTDIDGDNSDIV